MKTAEKWEESAQSAPTDEKKGRGRSIWSLSSLFLPAFSSLFLPFSLLSPSLFFLYTLAHCTLWREEGETRMDREKEDIIR